MPEVQTVNEKGVTLGEYLNRSAIEPALKGLLLTLIRTGKTIHHHISRAGVTDILGEHGTTNVYGESVKKLDILANDWLKEKLGESGYCAGFASEEEKSFVPFDHPDARYVVSVDPLDGSSNIDVSIPVGTIFSVHRTLEDGKCTDRDFLYPANRQVLAGYILYGSSTVLMFTTGSRVDGFTLDINTGEFCLSHPGVQVPEKGKYYSVNQGNFNQMPDNVQQYLEYCMEKHQAEQRPYSLRYVGSMVADVHRTLLKGGIFMYPATKRAPQGKLRLLFEAAPMAMLMEAAGGKALDGNKPLMDIKPTNLHQQIPVFIGSKNMVDKLLYL